MTARRWRHSKAQKKQSSKRSRRLQVILTGVQKVCLCSVLKALALEVVIGGLLIPVYPKTSKECNTCMLTNLCTADQQTHHYIFQCSTFPLTATLSAPLVLYRDKMPFTVARVRQRSGIYIKVDEMRTLSNIKSEWSKAEESSLHGSFFFHWFLFSPEENTIQSKMST